MIEVRKRAKNSELVLCGDVRDGETLVCLRGGPYRRSATRELFLCDRHFAYTCEKCGREYKQMWRGLL